MPLGKFIGKDFQWNEITFTERIRMNRNWFLVVIAGLIEILWAIGLKHTSNWISWAGIALLIYISFSLLVKATKSLPVATVYASFTGIGTAGM